jgi:hypothetical protein
VASDSLGGRSLRGRGVVVSQPHLFVLLVDDITPDEAVRVFEQIDVRFHWRCQKYESAYLQLGPDWPRENITDAYAKQLVEQCLKYWRQRQPYIDSGGTT